MPNRALLFEDNPMNSGLKFYAFEEFTIITPNIEDYL
jgi:hypothetical protein